MRKNPFTESLLKRLHQQANKTPLSAFYCRRHFVFAFLLLLLTTTLISAQQTRFATVEPLNYGFVSPNTRDDLKLADAIRGLNSAEESSLLRRAKNLGCVVKKQISAVRALGSWSDGAEYSVLLRTRSDVPTLRYLMSRLGREVNQKAVIYFHPDATGSARLYAIRTHPRLRGFQTIARILDQGGLAFRTLVPSKQRMIVFVVDLDNNLAAQVKSASERLKGQLTTELGTASFIGDDSDRAKGQAVFDQEIKDYETKHPNLPPPCTDK